MIFPTDAIRVRRTSETTRSVEVFGELDISSAPRLEELLAVLAVPPTSELLLDLAGVSLLDAFAMRCILRAEQKLAAGGCTLVIVGVQPHVRHVMELVGFDRAVTIRQPPGVLAEPA